ADLEALVKGFTPTISVWDAKSGERRYSIPVSAAEVSWPTSDWYARWLDNSRLLVVRLWRLNPAKAAHRLRFIVVDTATGRVVKVSEDLDWAGEHLILSPDRKMAVVQDDNYIRRKKDQAGLEGFYRNIYARTCVLDLERLTLVSSWCEPVDPNQASTG